MHDAFEESPTTQCTLRTGEVVGRTVSIIDTPGVFGDLSENDLNREVERCIQLSLPGPHAFLLVIQMEAFNQNDCKMMDWLQGKFGAKALGRTLMVFVGRECVTKNKWKMFLEKKEIGELRARCGGAFALNTKVESSQHQITQLLETIDSIVKSNGGAHYCDKIYVTIERLMREEDERKRNPKRRFQRRYRLWLRRTICSIL